MNNADYWKTRFEILEASQIEKGEAYFNTLDKQYKRASLDIEKQIANWYNRFASNNQISMTEAKKLFNSRELAEFRWDVEDYIKYGQENEINAKWMKQLENASARVHISRLEALQLQMQQQIEVLYGNQLDDVDSLARDIYSDGYYHTAFEVQKGFGVGHDLQSINNEQLSTVLSKPWTLDKRTFSDRIWDSKDKLVTSVQSNLTQSIMRGDAPDKVIKNISKQFSVSKAQAGRLVMTESAAFASIAQQDCFNSLNVDKYEIVATLDMHTSELCQSLDGGIHDMKDYKVGLTAPPFHPWCRTVTVPWFEDNYGERIARGQDGKTYYVPADMRYDEWKKTFVDNGSKDGLKVVKPGDIINKTFVDAKSIKEAEEYANNVLGISNVSYNGVDVETANRWNEGLKDNFDRFPELKSNFGFVGECNERNKALEPEAKKYFLDVLIKDNPQHNILILEQYADMQTNNFMKQMAIHDRTMAESWSPTIKPFSDYAGVMVNGKYGIDSIEFVESLKINLANKFHPIGSDSIRFVLDHEIGHQLDDLLNISNNKVVQELYNNRTNLEIAEGLSEYTWNNDNADKYSEMIAEAWGEYCNNDNPREIAKTIGKIIEDEYKLKFGRD